VGLEQGPLSLVSTTEELLDRKVAAPVWKSENMSVGIRHTDHVAPSIFKKLAITSPTSDGRSVGIVRSRTQTMEFSFIPLKMFNPRGLVYPGFNITAVEVQQYTCCKLCGKMFGIAVSEKVHPLVRTFDMR
jgi:hypothetical protein